MPKRRLTKEILAPLVASSVSVAEVMRKLGYTFLAGGTHYWISSRIRNFGLDTSHFLGQAASQGTRHKGGPQKLTASKILVLQKYGKRNRAHLLRRALLEIGREHKCAKCGLSKWQKTPLRLEIHHIDGNPLDDRAHNLEFICPNCHSLIPNHKPA